MSTIFHTQEPNDLDLRKYISYYYFHGSEDADNQLSFSYYPHFKNALTIYKDSIAVMITPHFSKVTPLKNNYNIAYSQVIKRFAKAEIHGRFQKIGVVFQPLGLNHFVSEPLSNLLTLQINPDFNYFNESLIPILDPLFEQVDITKKVDVLDAYFKSQFKGFDDQRMKKAMEMMLEEGEKHSVQEVADAIGTSRKTLLRMFQKHLNCSVQDYTSLIQFRKAVEVYQKAAKKPSFTGLSLDLNYYDQSDFIHHFTKTTGVSPKKFFNNLQEFGKNETFWSPD